MDVFIVRSIKGAGGDAPTHLPGPIDKDADWMNGVVVPLNDGPWWTGHGIAHELGHYLGPEHTGPHTNLMCANGGYDSVEPTPGQIETMKAGPLMLPAC